jgi:hypothetical protein
VATAASIPEAALTDDRVSRTVGARLGHNRMDFFGGRNDEHW